MRRNLAYIIILLVLGAAAYFLVIKKPWGTLETDESTFAVEDTGGITRIFIADMKGDKIILDRQKNGWVVNEKYPARNDYVQVLLSTIKNVSVNYPVPNAAQSTVVREMATNNKKVEIYNFNGDLMKSYYVGGSTLDNLGTYMLLEGAKKPYVTVIPGFMGVLGTRYITDIEKVRNLNIYSYKLNEISELSVKYHQEPDSSFTIKVLGPDSFQLQDVYGKEIPSTQVDRNSFRDYLNQFRFINAEAFVNDLSKKDSILQTPPFCTITLIDRQGQPHAVTCYYMPVTQESVKQYDDEGNPVLFDQDRYFASINNGSDFVIIQQYHFGGIFKNISAFLAKQNLKKS